MPGGRDGIKKIARGPASNMTLETNCVRQREIAQTNIRAQLLQILLRGRYKIQIILPIPVCFHQTCRVEDTSWAKAFQSY